jgi:ABC-type nitrate/sulfonate/bicarbonate transport system substrate-binding protein
MNPLPKTLNKGIVLMVIVTRDPAEEDAEEKLDPFLPDNIDRRKFFQGAVGVFAGGLLAGCSGTNEGQEETQTSTEPSQEGGEQTQSSSDDRIVKNVTFRTAWKANVNYSICRIAEGDGHWVESGITPPTVRDGNGSGDTMRRVGTGQEVFGMASITPQITGFSEDLDFKIVGTAKARTQYGLLYRKDRIDSPTGEGLRGKRIILGSSLAEQQWPLYTTLADVPDDHEAPYVSIETAPSNLAKGDSDAIFTSLNIHPTIIESLPDDIEFGIKPMYHLLPLYGYTLFVNEPWLNESDENLEYATRLLEGYSSAMKWVMLHPEETVEVMRQDVNPALQTGNKATQVEALKAGIAGTNLTEQTRENGLCSLDRDVLANSLERQANLLDVDQASVETAADFRLQENAELATFTDQEFNEVTEKIQPWYDVFENNNPDFDQLNL